LPDVTFTSVFVSHHQFQVLAGGESGDYLGLYTVGDDLLQVTGRAQLTVLTGPHTGRVEVAAEVLPVAPPEDLDGWDAAAEATVWCPTGRVAVCGLMGDCPDALAGLAVGGPGLLRVRVYARSRRTDEEPPGHGAEQYRVCLWPVDADTGFRSLAADALTRVSWTPDPARAAGWAMVRLLQLADPERTELALRRAAALSRPEPPVERVDVRRHRSVPAAARALLHRPADLLGAVADGADLVLPAGDVEVRIRPTATGDRFAGQWRWAARPGAATAVPDDTATSIDIQVHPDAATAVPDEATTSVDIQVHPDDAATAADLQVRPGPDGGTVELRVLHAGVPAPDAVLLGLVWDHLLDRIAGGAHPGGHPWQPRLAELAAAATARAEAARRGRDALDAKRWAGRPPTERLRGLNANGIGLARLDRPLLDALADAPEPAQRDLARWAARRACAIAGLDTIDWIAAALDALDRGGPLPAPFEDPQLMWQRLWADRRVPRTTVTLPDGTPNCSQQAIALPAVTAAGHGDALAAAVDTVYFAALAAGGRYLDVLGTAAGRLGANPA
jgi:hypothetical protein